MNGNTDSRSGKAAPLMLTLFLFSFALRAGVLFSGLLPEAYFTPRGEIGRVAVSLSAGQGYSDPYMIPTGPTAHPTPIYTGLLGLVYHLAGVTRTAQTLRALIAIASFSALVAMLPWLACKLGLGRRTGLIAGAIGGIFPQQGLSEIIGGGDQPFPGIALGLLGVAFVDRWTVLRSHSVARSLLLGAACGFALHLSPPLLLVFLGWVLFELIHVRNKRRYLLVGCLALGCLMVCLPWAWRNYAVFHRFVFIRDNLGLELRLANHPGALADLDETAEREGILRHPSQNLEEARLVRDLGEAEYMRRAGQEALAWIREHPAGFLRLTLLRSLCFWCGSLRAPVTAVWFTAVTALAILGLRRCWHSVTAPQRAVLVVPLVAFPLTYYVVAYLPHYRAPLQWLLLLLASYEISDRPWRPKPVPAENSNDPPP